MRYQLARWKKARVNIDYHVEFERHYYSVPYALVRQQVEIRYTQHIVEILHRGQRVASHRRSRIQGAASTCSEHRPQCHRRYLEWSPSRLISWATKIGPHCGDLVEKMLGSRRYPEQAYRSCLGLLRLGKTFGEDRLEAACHRALAFSTFSYQSVKSILKTGLDSQPLPETQPPQPALEHSNLRGADYFTPEDNHAH
jgi:transposase